MLRMFEPDPAILHTKFEFEFDAHVPPGEEPQAAFEKLVQERELLIAYLYAIETSAMATEKSTEHSLEHVKITARLEYLLLRASRKDFLIYATKIASDLIAQYKVEDIKSHLEEVFAMIISSSPKAIARMKKYYNQNQNFQSSPEERGLWFMVNTLGRCHCPLTAKLFFGKLSDELRNYNILSHYEAFDNAIDCCDVEMMQVLLDQLNLTRLVHEKYISQLWIWILQELKDKLDHISFNDDVNESNIQSTAIQVCSLQELKCKQINSLCDMENLIAAKVAFPEKMKKLDHSENNKIRNAWEIVSSITPENIEQLNKLNPVLKDKVAKLQHDFLQVSQGLTKTK